jgi:hypothetical protein
MADDRKSKRGPKPIDPIAKRSHCVSTRLNTAELHALDAQRGEFQRGEWMRMAALDKLPPSIPEVNRLSYIELGRIGANLNQVARRLNTSKVIEIIEVKSLLDDLRLSLLDAKP